MTFINRQGSEEKTGMIRDPVCQMDLDPRQAKYMGLYNGRSYPFCSKACKDKFEQRPSLFLEGSSGLRLTVGVMGSADNNHPKYLLRKAFELGVTIAEAGYVLITGACPGLPYECALGARNKGGLSVGISPAMSLAEHIHKYLSPADAFDVLIFTGHGLMGREVTNIHSSDMVVFLGGRSGTLGEFAIAYDEGKLIGVLEGSGGIADSINDIVAGFEKDTGAQLVFDDEPKKLIGRLSEAYTGGHFRRPSCLCDEYTAEPRPAADGTTAN